MNKQNNSKQEQKIIFRVSQVSEVLNTKKSNLHTLNLPEGDEYIGTTFDIINDSEDDVVCVVGDICSENKKAVQNVLVHPDGCIQFHGTLSDGQDDDKCSWVIAIATGQIKVAFVEIDSSKQQSKAITI